MDIATFRKDVEVLNCRVLTLHQQNKHEIHKYVTLPLQ